VRVSLALEVVEYGDANMVLETVDPASDIGDVISPRWRVRERLERFSARLAMVSSDAVARKERGAWLDDETLAALFLITVVVETRLAAWRRFWNQAVTALRSLR
jgi:hypothetical protein